ncbi:uncharacterized protein HMPREF1541_04680 [Cyphellophora europaea CBS 101466]|uniref:Glutamyl-tRNA synthetase n=1 Tax=Cyphellophora europaea (strain CBS 101466) TaxID=1220924 RepID=W2RXC5_CYPE1|nr:uncharacterized protein HMPREF1541_04680 [Cyphellophora europaea CBS 101466]ETN40403.1 hypothetical protein HMPREF1541_04680 [Cyphellophora europaea CBS 101466]
MAPDVPAALSAIDAAHALDPNTIISPDSQSPVPYELHYALKCTAYLRKHTPEPSPLLTVAVRAQHFRRWEVPRDSFPRTKPGYFAWRTHLKKRQAQQVKEICLGCGFSEDEAARVAALIAKEDLKSGDDEEAQALEDVACLVFLDDQFDGFEKGVEEEKMVGILRKTWGKMGGRGREMVQEMELSERAKELVGRALAG